MRVCLWCGVVRSCLVLFVVWCFGHIVVLRHVVFPCCALFRVVLFVVLGLWFVVNGLWCGVVWRCMVWCAVV